MPFSDIDIPNPFNLSAIRDLATSFPPIRPLDPNGIDVVGELPIMQRAYASTMNGTARNGRQEAGYSIFRSDPGYGHSGFYYGDTGINIPTASNTIATVHTHSRTGLPTPSPTDLQGRLPEYVFSGNQLYVTDPKTKKFYKYDIDKWNVPGIPQHISNAFILAMHDLANANV